MQRNKMQKCMRCGKTEEDSTIHMFLYPCLLCTECLDEFTPQLEDALALFCVEHQEGLRIRQFKTYLKERGWENATTKRIEIERFVSPTTKYVTVDIPARVELVDSTFCLQRTLETLSAYEARKTYEILNDICVCAQ